MKRRGFTFVELAVVMTIVGIFAVLVIPSLAGASAPMGGPLQTLLEADLQRARTESIARGEAIVLHAREDGTGWHLAKASDADAAIEGTSRRFGSGVLGPYKGCSLRFRGDDLADPVDGWQVVAQFDALGVRDLAVVDLQLRDASRATIGSWQLASGRSRLTAR